MVDVSAENLPREAHVEASFFTPLPRARVIARPPALALRIPRARALEIAPLHVVHRAYHERSLSLTLCKSIVCRAHAHVRLDALGLRAEMSAARDDVFSALSLDGRLVCKRASGLQFAYRVHSSNFSFGILIMAPRSIYHRLCRNPGLL